MSDSPASAPAPRRHRRDVTAALRLRLGARVCCVGATGWWSSGRQGLGRLYWAALSGLRLQFAVRNWDGNAPMVVNEQGRGRPGGCDRTIRRVVRGRIRQALGPPSSVRRLVSGAPSAFWQRCRRGPGLWQRRVLRQGRHVGARRPGHRRRSRPVDAGAGQGTRSAQSLLRGGCGGGRRPGRTRAGHRGRPDGSADLVVSRAMLHWLPLSRYPRCFEAVHRVLKPGGWYHSESAGAGNLRTLSEIVELSSNSSKLQRSSYPRRQSARSRNDAPSLGSG